MLTALNDALPRPRWMALSADPVFRILVSLAVIGGGVERLGPGGATGSPLAWSSWFSGAILTIFGISLALGLWTRLAALLLLATWGAIILAMAACPAPDRLERLLESLAILGALYLIYVRGGGQVSLDGARRKRALGVKPSPGGRAISRN